MRLSVTLFAVLLILVALFTLAARIVLPALANYKSTVEARVSDTLNSPVEIGGLALSWEGFGPMLIATDVQVHESDSRKVSIEQLLIDVNLAGSLLKGSPDINELSLVGANLAVEAGSDGQLRLYGMRAINPESTNQPTSAKPEGPGVDLMGWLFNTKRVGLLDSTVNLIDRQTNRNWIVEDLSIRAENTGDLHKLRVDLTLPEELGGKIEAGIDLTGDAQELAASVGNFYVSGDSLQLRALMNLLRHNGFMAPVSMNDVHLDASLELELWGEWAEGRLLAVRGPLRSENMIDSRDSRLLLDSLSAQLNYEHDQGVEQLTLSDIDASLEAMSFQIDQLRGSRNHNTNQGWSISGRGEQFPLQEGTGLPLTLLSHIRPALAERLSEQSLAGTLTDWEVTVDVHEDSVVIDTRIAADSVVVQPSGRWPGIGPVDAQINLANSKGRLVVSASDAKLRWHVLNDDSNTLDQLNATIEIDLSDKQRQVANASVQLLDDGITADTRLKVSLVPGQSPHLDMQSRYQASDVVAFKQWLPRKLLSRGTTRWIDRAIEAGRAEDGSLLFFGHLSEFPFIEDQGVFRSSVNIKDGQLAFLPSWPVATAIDGTLEVDRLTITGSARSSRLDSFDVGRTQLRIADFRTPILELSGTSNGDLQKAIDFGREGPLSAFLKPALSDISATGATDMDIELLVPLYRKPAAGDDNAPISKPTEKSNWVQQIAALQARRWEPMQVNGSIFLNGNSIRLGQANMDFKNAQGAIGFDLRGIRINDLQANMLGRQVLIDAQTLGKDQVDSENAVTQFTLQGALEAGDLLAHYKNPIDQFIHGASRWDVRVEVPHSLHQLNQKGVSLFASSDLTGTQIKLPAPYTKVSAQAVPIELKTVFKHNAESAMWEISYGKQWQALAQVNNGLLDSLLIQLGDVALNEYIDKQTHKGIRIQGDVDLLVADAWVRTIATYIESLPGSGDTQQKILPISVQIDAKNVQIGSRLIGAASLKSNSDEVYLNLLVKNRYLQGNLRYPRWHRQSESAMKVRVDRMDWAFIDALNSIAAEGNGERKSGELDPRLLPPLQARISQLTRGDVTIRDLVLRAEPDVSGMELTTIGFAYDTMRLIGNGYWHLRDPQGVNAALAGKHSTQLNLSLLSDDFGAGFRQIGLNDVILDGEGSVDVELAWDAPFYKPSIKHLDGTVNMQLEKGSIVPFEPGAGRLVGLFALQALPRRLSLDFKDITADGLAFKRITGDVQINQGVADVKLVQLTGPIGVVDIVGKSDLLERDFQQEITVLPRVSAALPIIGAISGGASAGIGVLVAAGFLKVLGIDFDRLGLRNYSLTGSWDKPVLKPM